MYAKKIDSFILNNCLPIPLGHILALKRARELGDFLIVGLYDDDVINQHKGSNYPILSLQERVLNVLAMKYVDEVIMGAPCKHRPYSEPLNTTYSPIVGNRIPLPDSLQYIYSLLSLCQNKFLRPINDSRQF